MQQSTFYNIKILVNILHYDPLNAMSIRILYKPLTNWDEHPAHRVENLGGRQRPQQHHPLGFRGGPVTSDQPLVNVYITMENHHV